MTIFRDALAAPGLSAIAEVKRRSPSAGDLRPDADPAQLAAQFARAGAAAVSILVDERFGGSLEDLKAARAATSAPLLAKGFFTEELDLLKLMVAGADAALILLRDVDDVRAAGLVSYAREIGIETLVEAHDANELQRAVALEAGADLLGFILAEESPRRAPAVLSVPDDCLSVAVFVGEAEEAGADLVQLYGREEGRVRGRDADLLRGDKVVARVVDLPWNDDDPLHVQRAAAIEGRVMLAGRLGPDNVREAVRAVRPWAVDAASKLEREPGIKDHDKVRAFVAAAR